MADLARLDSSAPGFDAVLARLTALESEDDVGVEAAVAAIVADARARGDAAVLEYTARFDRVQATSVAALELPPEELAAAYAALAAAERDALATAAERIRAYHERQRAAACSSSWEMREADGTRLGQKVTALARVGVYVPGGKAAYPSTVLMNALPARIAGVADIVMTVPTPDGVKHPLLLAAAHLAGVTRAFAIGGAQAIAALAYGTATIPAVAKIVGPGNAYVAAAKRLVFGKVGIDMIAGPSEVLILADGTGNAAWIAADLLAQAEHDPSAQAILITDDAALADEVERAVAAQLGSLPRAAIAAASWRDFGAIILVRRLDDAVPIVDAIAPEHLEIASEQAEALAGRIRNAGAIFLGAHTPEAIGDYVGGCNHVLPTARSARFSSGLGVLDFMKRTSILKCGPDQLRALGSAAMTLGKAEGLDAHSRSVGLRLNLP